MTELFHASFSIPATHPAFPGHFPGHPIVPGVVLLDRAILLIQELAQMRVTAIANAKFLSPVSPDETLDLEFSCAGLTAQLSIRTGQRHIASAKLQLADVDL